MDYYNNNDYELVYLIKESAEEEALNIMFKKYEPLIRKVASYYYSNNKNLKIEYDDLIQEGRIGLCEAIKGYKLEKNVLFFTFAFLCIKRQIIDYVTKSKRQKSIGLSTAIHLDIEYDDKSIDYNDPLILIQEEDIINNIINFKNNLDFIDANIFELRYNSFSYNQIGEVLDINKKTVDNRLQKIRKKLKKYLLEI